MASLVLLFHIVHCRLILSINHQSACDSCCNLTPYLGFKFLHLCGVLGKPLQPSNFFDFSHSNANICIERSNRNLGGYAINNNICGLISLVVIVYCKSDIFVGSRLGCCNCKNLNLLVSVVQYLTLKRQQVSRCSLFEHLLLRVVL